MADHTLGPHSLAVLAGIVSAFEDALERGDRYCTVKGPTDMLLVKLALKVALYGDSPAPEPVPDRLKPYSETRPTVPPVMPFGPLKFE